MFDLPLWLILFVCFCRGRVSAFVSSAVSLRPISDAASCSFFFQREAHHWTYGAAQATG